MFREGLLRHAVLGGKGGTLGRESQDFGAGIVRRGDPDVNTIEASDLIKGKKRGGGEERDAPILKRSGVVCGITGGDCKHRMRKKEGLKTNFGSRWAAAGEAKRLQV